VELVRASFEGEGAELERDVLETLSRMLGIRAIVSGSDAETTGAGSGES
jgi:hypothetical protein